MRFGLAIPQYGFSLPSGRISFEDAAVWARTAEDLGFDSVWLSDHLFYSFSRYGADPTPISALEPLATLGGLAAVTERVRLGVLVLCAAFRHPALVAKAAATIDVLSAGRLELGLGAGWLEEEFHAFGYRFAPVGERFTTLQDALAITHRMLGGTEPVVREGALWSVDGVRLSPAPTQDPVPVWVGGKGGPRLPQLAARYATGWNAVWRIEPGSYRERIGDVGIACERVGRDPATFRRTIGLYTLVAGTEKEARSTFERARAGFPGDAMRGDTWTSWRADTLSGSPEQAIERIGSFAELGVEEIVVSPWVLPFAVMDPAAVELFAERVVPACR